MFYSVQYLKWIVWSECYYEKISEDVYFWVWNMAYIQMVLVLFIISLWSNMIALKISVSYVFQIQYNILKIYARKVPTLILILRWKINAHFELIMLKCLYI